MNKQFRQKYKTILENKLVNLDEMRSSYPGGWGRFWKLLERMPRFRDMFRDLDDLRQWVVLRRLNRMEGRGTRFLFTTTDAEAIRKLNSDYPQLGGWIEQLIITEDGAHLIPFGSPRRYYYLPGPGQDPIMLPPTFNPHVHDVPGHTPWIDDNGNVNPDYVFPVLVPIGVGVGVGTIVFGNEPASADPFFPLSPSNQPGWHPPELPPIVPPAPPWYSPLSPMDPNQPNFGLPGY